MDRLTHERVNGIKSGYWSQATKEQLVQRLAAYENTGLEPEEINCGKKKCSQKERVAEAENLLESVWEEFLQGKVDDDHNLRQGAVYVQVYANRIVWKLNNNEEAEYEEE